MFIWIEQHPSLASWLQAFFSVLAIIFASFTPWLHERSKERRAVANSRRLYAFLAHRQYELFIYLQEPLRLWPHDLGAALEDYVNSGEYIEWESHRSALEKISIAGFSAKEVNSVMYLRSAADYALGVLKGLSDWKATDDSAIHTLQKIRSYTERSSMVYKASGIVSDQELF